ncbi:adenylate/guanylate cyclase domain-containing protein [Mesorhizobium xinjiangense]|uniref:adenylate/guanylate cyclase domain-containing protein n=1 Tax=Mesorhizobium xinjiangense TaxID=2678685 RepID=UPI0012ED0DF7|nr:adenylate/guanylate cyclase domain-containing protein [Mesorhizobium xinjiangense]
MLARLREFLSGPDLSAIPPRIVQRIAQRDWSNDILLRAIQLAIVLLFCILYAVSPKTYPQDAFTPVPYVLAAYLSISVVVLAWSCLRPIPDWANYLSILFDFSLLYGLLISFHIQYEQPASFVLKAPTLLYVFIFIAIRALRFHPKFVLVAGMAALAGMAFMIVYVTRIDPADSMLTRSYVEYLTSNSILIGAEIDKMISILFVTAVLAIAVNGSRKLLVTAVAEQSAAEDFERFFDSAVARNIRTAQERIMAGNAEKRLAAILNVDIRGFTALAEQLDADSVIRVLSAYQGRVIPLVQRNNGVIDKFMGDGIMASFGIGGASETFAADAIRAAEAILADIRDWGAQDFLRISQTPLRIGIGIATGTVSWGALGQDQRLEMTVIGPAVNLSARLEKHNKTLGSNCVVDARSWKLAREQGYAGALDAEFRQAKLDGVRDPVRIAVLSLHDGNSPARLDEVSDVRPAGLEHAPKS